MLNFCYGIYIAPFAISYSVMPSGLIRSWYKNWYMRNMGGLIK